MAPQISVIIPCYNIAPYIAECIDSVLVQSFADFELLLIDDGSNDDTLSIIGSYAEKDGRIKVFSHSNKGVSHARNRGIENAKGSYLMFMDGDDFIKPDYLKKHIEAAEKGAWVISGFVNVRNKETTENKDFHSLLKMYPDFRIPKNDLISVLKYSSLSSPCARLYFKELIDKQHILFNEKISYQEDLMFNLEYVKHTESIRLIPYFGYCYVEHPESSTGRFHTNFDYTDNLFRELNKLITNRADQKTVEEFVFQTHIKKIANLFHADSAYKRKEKLNFLNQIIHSPFFITGLKFLPFSAINPVLKTVLKTKNKYLIYCYFKWRKKFI